MKLQFATPSWYMLPSAVANVVTLFGLFGEAKALISDTRGEGPQAIGAAKYRKKRRVSGAPKVRPTTTKHRGPSFAAEMIRLVMEKKQAGETGIYQRIADEHGFSVGNLSGWWKNRDKILKDAGQHEAYYLSRYVGVEKT